jgi:hypothetical protein
LDQVGEQRGRDPASPLVAALTSAALMTSESGSMATWAL